MAGKVNGNGKIQVSMWMDQELAERVERAAEELNNSLSGMSGYLIKPGLEGQPFQPAHHGGNLPALHCQGR